MTTGIKTRNGGRTKETYFWKAAVILMGLVALSAGLIKTPGFWTSYALDIAGPAMGYLLIRGRYTSDNATFLSIKFSPEWAAILIIGICSIIETGQYLHLYNAHFDPFDYLAYTSGVLTFYITDKWIMLIKGGLSS